MFSCSPPIDSKNLDIFNMEICVQEGIKTYSFKDKY